LTHVWRRTLTVRPTDRDRSRVAMPALLHHQAVLADGDRVSSNGSID
jgi:hypothetical protein